MPAQMMHRKTITMRNSHYQQQSHRGSTPSPEMQQGLERNPSDQATAEPSANSLWTAVERLWPPDQLPECSVATQPVD